ncbi:MAG: cystathionine beta-lyase [Phyllobacteriaceae bacterium]|nr:cystathionine beta-lyase [Phyllobacteriaceae bacterium]
MSEKTGKPQGINTRLAHMGWNPRDYFGFVNPPITRGSTILFPDAATMESRDQPYTYGTRGTPTHTALENAVNELEGSAGTILLPSGLAAVTIPLLAYAEAGSHMLITDAIYNPTRRMADTMLRRMGVEVEYYDPLIGADIARLMRPNTRVVFTEAPASNTFEMQDVPAIAEVARAHGAVTMMDNTYATPLFFKPLDHGVDISIHAATKYPAGHADILFGMVSANARAWERIHDTHISLGCPAHPEDVFLVLRGLRTMALRLERHQASTLAVSSWLLEQPGIRAVLNPALPHDPGHSLFTRDFSGSTSVFSVVLDGTGDAKRDKAKAHAFLDGLRIFGLGYSWGGYESLAVHVWLGDRTISRRDYGGPVIRLQIGIEDVADLQDDLAQALAAANAA